MRMLLLLVTGLWPLLIFRGVRLWASYVEPEGYKPTEWDRRGFLPKRRL